MRHLIVAIAVFVAALPVSAFAVEYDTIDDLVGAYNDEKCGECHSGIYEEWKTTPHADSVNISLDGLRNFLVFGVKDWWDRKISKQDLMKCVDCHAPVMRFASEALAVEVSDMIITAQDTKNEDEKARIEKELAKLNVGCLSCHNLKATSIAPGRLGEPQVGAVYGVRGISSPAHTTIKSAEMKTAGFCGQCHGVYTAPDGETIWCNTLSGSYQDAYVSGGGSRTCQDCHMKENGRGHRMLGGRDLELVKEGIGFNLEVSRYEQLPGKGEKRWTPSAIVGVELENRAGHRIPDG